MRHNIELSSRAESESERAVVDDQKTTLTSRFFRGLLQRFVMPLCFLFALNSIVVLLRWYFFQRRIVGFFQPLVFQMTIATIIDIVYY